MVQDVKHVTEHFIHICRSTEQRISVAVLSVYKVLLQLVAFILAIRTQRIKIKGLNEAKFIIAAVYASSLGLVLATLTHFILVEYENVHAVLFAVALGFSGTAILGLLFIPKVIGFGFGFVPLHIHARTTVNNFPSLHFKICYIYSGIDTGHDTVCIMAILIL